MAKLHVSLIWPGCAQGNYRITARGFFLAALRWGDEMGPLAGWDTFGYVPIDPAGNGTFLYSGMRAIPFGANRVWARCVSHDFTAFEDVSCEIPGRFLPGPPAEGGIRFSILTDMHLSSKPWRVRRALDIAESDTLLLLGDSTNDGLEEQFASLEACVADKAPDKILLPVPGNHDITHPKRTEGDGCRHYAAFQAECLRGAEAKGFRFERLPDSLAWATRRGGLDIIGMQCVISGRIFRFPEERQLDWLEARLAAQRDADWHVILCHAPLLHHNPHRSEGRPYMEKDRRLTRLVEASGRVLFLSGHTHNSPNTLLGAAEWDSERENLYLNCGSVTDTMTEGDSGLMAADWKAGVVTELSLSRDAIEISTHTLDGGTRFPRGCYRFHRKEPAHEVHDGDQQADRAGAAPQAGGAGH